MNIDLLDIMALADERNASDVHIAPGRKPVLRKDGFVSRLEEYDVLSPEESERLLYTILDDQQRLKLDQTWEIDFSKKLQLSGHAVRFRINMFRQNRGLAAVFRLIPDKIFAPEEIGLEEAILNLTKLARGLVLVTGPTGSGKTTTLATMLDQINRREALHILTIEDPIEFEHPEYKCVVTQRELGAHTKSFRAALRSALREDPDVILVGEMRDFETISLALTAAETGHLVFATLHTTDASQTIDRIIDVFPPAQQAMVRTQLGNVLQAVVCQVLLPKAIGKGRVAGREILLANSAVGTLIRENQSHLIYNAMAMGIADGMCPLEWSLAEKVQNGMISLQSAISATSRVKSLMVYIDGGGAAQKNGGGPMLGLGAQQTTSTQTSTKRSRWNS